MGESQPDDDVTVVRTTAGTAASGGPEAHLRAGDVVGRYRLLERLGSGGMGVVWVARDPQLERRVAVKVLHELGRRPGSQGQERMRREAIAQAGLSHPNVVGIYDVGVHDGRLFLTMELVVGRTLEQWAADEPDLAAIVGVFEQAAAGLEAVHQAGFIHRDFKPSNVMIDGQGRALVMDFGLARLGDPETASGSAAAASASSLSLEGSQVFSTVLTCDGVIMGTPAYMAPEQHLGRDADARADQFSLCAALFETLVGRRPFAGSGVKQLAHAKLHGTLDFSGARVSIPRALEALLRRGLDPEPSRRHPSMREVREGLAALRRRRSPVRPVALATAGLLALGGIGWAGLSRADDDACVEDAQQLQRVWNDEVELQLRGAFRATELGYAEDAAERTAAGLDDYTARWADAYRDACRATTQQRPAEGLDLRLACLAEARDSVALTVGLLLDADASGVARAATQVAGLPPLHHCEDFAVLRAGSRGAEDSAVAAAADAVRSQLERARTLALAGRYEEGRTAADEALVRARALAHEPSIARALVRLGALELDHGRPEAARDRLTEAAVLAAGIEDYATATEAATRLVFVCAEKLGLQDEALSWSRHAEASLARMPADVLARARLDSSLGVLHSVSGEYAQALECFERAHEILGAQLDPEHPEAVGALENIGLAYVELGQPQRGAELLSRSAAIMEKVLGPQHPDYGHSLMNLGYVAGVLGHHDEAIEHYSRMLHITRDALGPHHPQVSVALASLGTAASMQDRLVDAERYYREAIAVLDGSPGEHLVDRAWLLVERADVISQLERYDEAVPLYRRARASLEVSYGADHDAVAHVLMSEAASLVELRRTDEAEAALDRAREILEARLPPDHPTLGTQHANRGDLLRAQGDLPGAAAELSQGLEITRAALGREHPAVASILLSLGEVQLERGEAIVGREHLREALRITTAGSVGEGFSAEIRFVLARSLWEDPALRAEARDLARAAREGFAGFGELFQPDVDEIDAWLRAHRHG
ncbi:MAG: tetratricopeptide repeat-containing serine/threonine-protein kinase [Nannocystaceae bacterium]